MTDDLGHYFEVPAERVDPARREAVAAVLPLLAADLELPALGLRGGLVVKWFRPTTPMQSPVRLPPGIGAPPPVGFVAVRGLKGLCRGRDPDGVVWLDADLPRTLERDGVLWILAHEAKHAQSLLRPGKGWEYIGEASCEVYAERFCAARKGEGQLRPGSRSAAPARTPAPPTKSTSWGPGSPTWVIPWQYSEPAGGRR